MKQLGKKLIATLILSIFLLPTIVFAQTTPPATTPAAPSSNETQAKITPDGPVSDSDLFPRFTYGDTATTTETKIGAVNKLPNKDWKETIISITKLMLNIVGTITLLSLTIGGAIMAMARGSEEILNKGKQITIDASIGLLVIALAYALVISVAEMQFLSGATGDAGSGSTVSSTPVAEGGPIQDTAGL